MDIRRVSVEAMDLLDRKDHQDQREVRDAMVYLGSKELKATQ